MIAVKDLTSHRTIRMPKDRDTDKTVYRGADTMLEGIFYQRYENKGSDLQRTSRVCLQIHTHFYQPALASGGRAVDRSGETKDGSGTEKLEEPVESSFSAQYIK